MYTSRPARTSGSLVFNPKDGAVQFASLESGGSGDDIELPIDIAGVSRSARDLHPIHVVMEQVGRANDPPLCTRLWEESPCKGRVLCWEHGGYLRRSAHKLSGAGEIVYVESYQEMMEFLAHNPNVTQSGTGGAAAGALSVSYSIAVVFDDAPGEERILSYTVLYNASEPRDMAAELMKAVDTALGMCSSRDDSYDLTASSQEQERL